MKTVPLFSCVCALSIALLMPFQVVAQTAGKQSPARSIPVKKVFQFYDMYLSQPAEIRDGFKMEYRISSPQSGLPRAQMNYVLGSTRTAIEIGPSGQILNMPDQAMFANGRIDIAANQPRGSITMNLVPMIPLSRSIPVTAATNPLTDYASAVGRAGPLAALAPKLKTIVFKGGTGGEAIFGDGRRIGLASTPTGIAFQPSAPNMRGAVNLVFATPPTSAAFSK